MLRSARVWPSAPASLHAVWRNLVLVDIQLARIEMDLRAMRALEADWLRAYA